MQMKLSENIRAFRKSRGLTQEQLADAMRVTVGAVSKWEAGLNTPDISLILELADFFETSVDVLLGYEWRSRAMGKTVGEIKRCLHAKLFDEGMAEADKALLKFPNCFEVAYNSAVLLEMVGLERGDAKASRRSLELYGRALELIEQNQDNRIGETTIRRSMANVNLSLGNTDIALEQLMKYNHGGCNNAEIGYTLARMLMKPDEAAPYLSDAIVRNVSQLIHAAIGLINVYAKQGDEKTALDMLEWIRGVIRGLKRERGACVFDKTDAMLLTGGAQMLARLGRLDEAREYLTRAKELALRFDAEPNYQVASIRFCKGGETATVFDDMCTSVMEGIDAMLREEDEYDERLLDIWNELKQAER